MHQHNNTSQLNSIAVIVCYIGSLPWYFQFFLHSCLYNPDVDFYVIGDSLPEEKSIKSDNVFFVHKTLKDISDIASKELSLRIDIQTAYKLCDFKPFYGALFQDIISGYTFWAHGDLDVIWGNIRNFFTDEILDNHEVLSVRHEYLTGYFTVYRNTYFINHLYTHNPNYPSILENQEYCSFDECGGLCMELIAGIPIDVLDSKIQSMTHIVLKMTAENKIRSYFDFHVIDGVTGKMSWNKGTLLYRNKYELILYHLINFKKIPNLQIPNFDRIPNRYYINLSGITEKRIIEK